MSDKKTSSAKIKLVTAPCVTMNVWTPPMGIAYLSGSLAEAGFDARCLDLNHSSPFNGQLPPEILAMLPELDAAKRLCKEFPEHVKDWTDRVLEDGQDIVGISVIFRSMLIPSMALALEIRKRSPKTKIMVGGPFTPPSNRKMLERLLHSGLADVISLGDSEHTVVELVNALLDGTPLSQVRGILYRDGAEIRATEQRPPADLDLLPLPKFDGLPLDTYKDAWVGFPLYGSRGCIMRCTFCNFKRYSSAFRQRSPDNIVKEIRRDVEKYGVRKITFTDNLINGNPKMFKDLCRAIIKERMDLDLFGWLALLPSVDKEMLDLMQQAGFKIMMMAIESPAPKVLRDMGKWDDIAGVNKIFKGCEERGMKPWVHLMHSFPTERDEDFDQLVHFVDGRDPAQYAGVVTWPFRLADVLLGDLDKEFIAKFGIEILGDDALGLSYWNIFSKEPVWRTQWVNEEVRQKRQEIAYNYLAKWKAQKPGTCI